MAQRDVLKLLKENRGEWFTPQDLAEKLEISSSTILNNLRKLKARYRSKIQRKYEGRRVYFRFKK